MSPLYVRIYNRYPTTIIWDMTRFQDYHCHITEYISLHKAKWQFSIKPKVYVCTSFMLLDLVRSFVVMTE